MAKFLRDQVLDAGLASFGTGTILTVTNAQPTTRTEAVTTYALADVVIDSGDFTISDGDVSGRKSRVGQQASVPIDTSGTATHVAICDATNVLAVTTCTSQALTAGGTVTVPAFDLEFLDVT